MSKNVMDLMNKSAAALGTLAGVDETTAAEVMKMHMVSHAERNNTTVSSHDMDTAVETAISERRMAGSDYTL